MDILGDFHVHTIASSHAYSTLNELVTYAAEKNIKYVGITDHGPKMLDGPHPYYFANLCVIPSEMSGVHVKKGIEINILDEDGNTDFEESRFAKLDYAIASFHAAVSPGGLSPDKYTDILETVMSKLYVKVIGHPGNPKYPIDIPRFVSLCKEYGVAVEINNSSFIYTRKGSYPNCLKIAQEAKEQGADILLSSDAHICTDLCNYSKALEIIEEVNIPKSQIINYNEDKIQLYFGGYH